MVYICGGILTFLFFYPAIYSYLNFLDCHGENELKPRDPNSQDIHEVIITIRPEVIQQFDVLQKEMFDLLL